MFILMLKTKLKRPKGAYGLGNSACLGSGGIKDDTGAILNIPDKLILKKASLSIESHVENF
jgi:hypothetical protein